ncbi:MAG TPA: DUF86 domain-containing protein [Terriglobales bacterium]|nr:DUF86 domain-containing protein [Terriglobales bacterium]
MRDDRLFLLDIIACAESIQSFVRQKSREDYKNDKLLQSALLHELSVIGEAGTKVSDALQDKYPAVPWREISGFRNQIVHAYFSLDLDIVWETVAKDVPELWVQVKEILSKEFQE